MQGTDILSLIKTINILTQFVLTNSAHAGKDETMTRKKMMALWHLYEQLKEIEDEIKRLYSQLSKQDHEQRRKI